MIIEGYSPLGQVPLCQNTPLHFKCDLTQPQQRDEDHLPSVIVQKGISAGEEIVSLGRPCSQAPFPDRFVPGGLWTCVNMCFLFRLLVSVSRARRIYDTGYNFEEPLRVYPSSASLLPNYTPKDKIKSNKNPHKKLWGFLFYDDFLICAKVTSSTFVPSFR